MKLRQLALAFWAIPLALAAVSCGSELEIKGTTKVFEAAPWTGRESATYRVTDRGVKGEGTCELITEPGPETTVLTRRCSNLQFRDDAISTVRSATLEPVRSERTLSDSKKGTSVTHAIAYAPPVATFSTRDGTEDRDTTRDLPVPTEDFPNPGWYDDDSLLWLARGIPLRDGFSGDYAHVINAGRPRIVQATARIVDKQRITVPAGTFDTWRVRFQGNNSVFYVWVTVSDPHTIVQARIEDTLYELRSSEPAAK